jgi:RNA recognition motif-containing protein
LARSLSRPVYFASPDPVGTTIVTDRDTGRSRGFGFVEMATNEDADQAVSRLNGSSLDGRTIKVEKATGSGPGGGRGGPRR